LNEISVEFFSSFNKAIQNIYQGATSVPSAEFNRWVLNTLAEVLPYDYALGSRLISDNPASCERFYFEHSSGALVGWNPAHTAAPTLLTGNDVLSVDAAFAFVQQPAGNETPGVDEGPSDRRLRLVYSQGSGQSHCFLALYRWDSSAPFSAHDHWAMRAILPHFIEAHRLVELSHRAGRSMEGSQLRTASALLDEEGRIIAADTDFTALCLEEWPDNIERIGADILDLRRNKTDAVAEVEGRTLHISVRRMAKHHHVTVRPKHELEKLPPRLLSIARLLGSGKSYKEVAKELGISPSTVTNQANQIYPRLGIKNKAELARLLTQCRFFGSQEAQL